MEQRQSFDPPKTDPPHPKENNAHRELKEWLGLTLADLLLYLSWIPAGAIFFTTNIPIVVLFSLCSLILSLLSCKLGIYPDPSVLILASLTTRFPNL